MALAAQSTNSLRYLYLHDVTRTKMSQDVRGALDLIGVNARQVGQSFTGSFPALQIVNGSGSLPDDLYMRRNLIDEVLNVCVSIAAGSNTSNVFFTNAINSAGCDRTSNLNNYNAWRNYRLAQTSQTVRAYIYNISTKQGEFFTYNGEVDSGTQLNITRTSGNWTYSYPSGSSAIYILEEYHFNLSADLLQLIVNNDNSNILNVAFGMTDFQASAKMQDGSTKSSFISTDDWTKLSYIELTLTAQDTFAKEPVKVALSSRFFPRNILSN